MDKLRASFEAKWGRDDRGCWIWTASTAGKGYGQLRIPGTRKNVYAHRYSYELYRGPIPKGAQLLHSCDNPRCVNPDHLTPGSAKDNAVDMRDKGRHLFGERNEKAKLTEKEVEAIKVLAATSSLSQLDIARTVGVHQTIVSKIVRGERWAHVRPDLTQQAQPLFGKQRSG